MWVYQGLNGEDTPTLKAMAEHRWPAFPTGMTQPRLTRRIVLVMFSVVRRRLRACRSSRTTGAGQPAMPRPRASTLRSGSTEGEWLDQVEALDGVPTRRTTVTIEHPKSILTRNSSPDIGFDRSVNAYRGCEHGCIYCFARPTHAYHDLSPGVDFESRLFVKPNAAQLLHAALVAARLRMPPDRHGHQHRSLSADRGTLADHPLGRRAAGRDAASLHDHDQVRPRAARPRPAEAGGGPAHSPRSRFR